MIILDPESLAKSKFCSQDCIYIFGPGNRRIQWALIMIQQMMVLKNVYITLVKVPHFFFKQLYVIMSHQSVLLASLKKRGFSVSAETESMKASFAIVLGLGKSVVPLKRID